MGLKSWGATFSGDKYVFGVRIFGGLNNFSFLNEHIGYTGHRYEINSQTSELGAQFAGRGLDQLQLHIIDCVKHWE